MAAKKSAAQPGSAGDTRCDSVNQQVCDGRIRYDRVGDPEERAGDAADDRAERLGRVAVEPARAGDAAPHFREAEPDEGDEHGADQVREHGGGAEHRGRNTGESEDA